MDINTEQDHLYKIRHSLAHVLAQAVLEVRPNSKLAFGPPIDNGCYYDFLFETPLSENDFSDIESRMRKIIGQRQEFIGSSLPLADAVKHLDSRGQNFKVEYCKELGTKGETSIGFYVNGPFEDMCAGPHVKHTGEIPPDCFKIDKIAGAYWRGDEKNPQLTRIYMVAFENSIKLKEYLKQRELAEARDHRKLGVELDLFSINHENVGGGLILWHPKGGIIRHVVESHCRAVHLRDGYDFVYTPHIGRAKLWETSGHLDFYKDGMFSPIDIEGQQYYLKPMNCPFHCHIYKSRMRSYRDLPKRFAEWGTVYRFERSGTLHGLTRVRGFTQDDAHLFCRIDQMPAEIDRVLNFSLDLLRDFGFTEFKLYLSTRPEKRVGKEEQWDAAETALREALERSKLPFSINAGDGAFYGPKIDVCLNDAIGRQWQLSTIQFDFNLPERFDLSYIGQDGQAHRPYMVHRALLGSLERFFALLIEHHGGAFPTWLAPVQVRIIPITDEQMTYAKELQAELQTHLVRVEIDDADETFNKKIRNSATEKIPNVAVIGGKEVTEQKVSWRRYGQKEQSVLTREEFIKEIVTLSKVRGRTLKTE